MQCSDYMIFCFAVILIFRLSEFLHRGKRISKTDGGRVMEGMATFPAGFQMGRKVTGTLAISGKMTNFEGKKC